jgi:glycosyltransferase involved in cell wall biosynthesis
MKVLLVAHGVTDQSLLGGPGRVAAAQANALVAAGHEVTVVTTDVTAKGRRTREATFALLDPRVQTHCIPGHTFRFWPGGVGPILHLGSTRVLATAVSEADAVHCHEWPHDLVQQALSLSRKQGKRHFVQPHGSIQPRRGMNWLLHALYGLRYPPRTGDIFIAGTPAEKAELMAALGPGVVVHQLVNPMTIPDDDPDGSRAAARRRSWGFPDGTTVLLYAHRIYPSKGLDLLIEAMELLPPFVQLAVVGAVGDATFLDKCSSLIERLGLRARVRFFSPVSRDAINEIIRAADMFVLPARRDTFPLMVLHAMACARAVVVTNTCQSVELLGHAVAAAEPSPNGLAERIAALLDPADRQLLGRRGYDLIRDEFAPDVVARKLVQIYTCDQ